MNWIDKLEKKFGRYAIHNLMYYVIMLYGLGYVINLMAVLSINLGLLNILPIPALDGSKLVFLAIEGIKGSPVSPSKENFVHFIGFALLMMLMIFITYKDILRLFS